MLLDTGSADLVRTGESTDFCILSHRQWVVSSACTEQDCQGVTKYNQSSSFTDTNTAFHLSYLLGSVTGSIGTDTVVVGPYEVSSQIFGKLDLSHICQDLPTMTCRP